MKLRVLVALGVSVLLAGCGSVHPGAAAVVDGTTIPMTRADDAATVYCQLSLLSAQEGQAIPNADVRRQAVADLVVAIVAEDLAEEAGIDPNPSSYEVTAAQRDQLAQSFPDDEIDGIIETINTSQRTFAIAQQLGARRISDPDVETQQLQDAGLEIIQDELSRRDVDIDPRFGIDGDLERISTTGSLSAAVEEPDESDPQALPATQQCVA